MPSHAASIAVRWILGRWTGRPDAVLVEFIGAAGVGKTFLADRVLIGLQETGIEAWNFDLIGISRIAPSNLVLALEAVYMGAMTRPKRPFFFARAVGVIARYSIRRRICEQVGGIHITSEGLFHRIIRLHRESRVSGKLQLADMLFRRIQPPDVVVVVEAKVEAVFARRSDRSRANDLFSVDSVKTDIADVKESIGGMEHVQRTLHPSMQILRIAADEEGGEAAVAEIIAALQ